MKVEKFLRTRIVLFLIIHFILLILAFPVYLVHEIEGYVFGKIYDTRPKLGYVTEKQFKSRLVRWYAGNFRGLYERDVRRRNGKKV